MIYEMILYEEFDIKSQYYLQVKPWICFGAPHKQT